MSFSDNRAIFDPHCPVCCKKLDGIFNPYCREWECSKHNKTDVLHAERGCLVRFAFPDNGYSFDRENAIKHLTVDSIYTVDSVDIGQSSSKIRLKECPGEYFNTVQFERVT